MKEQRLMTATEVAEWLRINIDTVYAKAVSGEMPSHKIGRSRRFELEELKEWLKQSRANASDVESGVR